MNGRTVKCIRALTVAELLVSVASISVIGAAAAGLSFAMSSAQAQSRDRYLHIQTARNASLRIERLIRGSLLVTSADDTRMILWLGDYNANALINRNEVALLRWDPATGEVGKYRVDLEEGASANYRVHLKKLTDISSGSQEILNDPRVVYTPIAQDVTEFELSCLPDAPRTRVVDFRLVVASRDSQGRPAALRGSVALRYGQADRVEFDGGEWVLEH